MKKHLPFILKVFPAIFILVFSFSQNSLAQNPSEKLWKNINESDISVVGKRYTFPSKFLLYNLEINQLKSYLNTAPSENQGLSNNIIITIPSPEGKMVEYKIVSYDVMHPLLAQKYPSIKTFRGIKADDESESIRIDYTNAGFHAMVISPKGNYFIDPYSENNTTDYIIYFKRDLPPNRTFVCNTEGSFESPANALVQKSSGTQLRTYRLALACTGEYAATKGGTVAGALSGMVTTMNRVNGVYESEVGIRMVMVANNDLICYTNASTDPYTNNNGSTMLGQNISTCNSVIGSANYDIGHVFSTGGGGVAYLGVPCGSNKAGGVTGSPSPVGDAYDIDYVAHEMGHQFGANHTFNSTTGSCGGGNRSSSAAYEPGSGITIMAYAGICGTDNLAAHSIAYFHTKSFDEIITYSQSGNGNSCAVITNTGNTAPIVNSVTSDYSIPISTPFILSGSATDANNDPLTYSWEQYDLGTAGAWNVQSTTAPMFRPFEPETTGARTFPKLSDILNNSTTIGELLPNQARTLKYRLTVRDGKGGVMHPDNTVNISVVNNGGAFKVTSPNTAVTWLGNSTVSVSWDVSGTTSSPINTSKVKISLSADGGNTFPYVLAESANNSGSASVQVPNIQTSLARVKVEAVGNIFFDISDKNFTVNAQTTLSNIITGTISPLSFCAGNNINVPFTIDQNASSGNTFIAQLSDQSGSFINPKNIGTLNSVSQGTISATIPNSITSGNGYRIRVISTNPAITGSANTSNITISNTPSASVASAGGPTTFCQGGSVTISGNTSGGTWNNGSNSTTITVNTSGNYFITNTNSCGTVTSNQITVIVNSLPAVNAGSYSNVTTNSPAFTLTGTPAGGTFSGVGVSENKFDPAVAGQGTFLVTYTFTNANGCTNTASTTVTVDAAPCNFYLTGITGDMNTCKYKDGNNAIYTANVSGASAIEWTAPANTQIISGQGTAVLELKILPSFTTGSLKVKAYNGCGGNPVAKTINLNSKLPATPGAITGPTSPCSLAPGEVVSYSISKVADASFYNWELPAGVNRVGGSAGINDTMIFVTFGQGFVSGSSIKVRSGSNCGLSTSVRTLVLKTQTVGTPSAISGQQDVCNATGNDILLRYSIKPVTNAISYSWNFTGNGAIVQHPQGEGSANDTVVFVKINSGFTSGTISVNAANGCMAGSARSLSLYLKSSPAPAAIYGNATPEFEPPVTNVCDAVTSGSYLTYSINRVKVPTDPSGFAAGYDWQISDNSNATIVHPNGVGANDTIVRVYFAAGFTSATLKVASQRECNTSTYKSITLTKKAPAPVSAINGDITSCRNEYKTYTVDGNSFSTYNWTVPSGVTIVSGQGTATLNLFFNSHFTGGTLRVSVSSACGTSLTTNLKITLCTAPVKPEFVKSQEPDSFEVSIFPNPNNGNFTVQMNDNSSVSYSLIDATGKIVQSGSKAFGEGRMPVQLKNDLKAGIYFLKIYNNKKSVIKKIIVDR